MGIILTHWRALAVLAIVLTAGAAIGVSRYQLANARLELAEFRRAYDLLAQSAHRQNAAILEAEQKAEAALARSRKLRAEAAGAIEVATKSADALARALRAPRPIGACPVNDALELVRADLGRAN